MSPSLRPATLDNIRSMMVAAAWERAKGALRECINLLGSNDYVTSEGDWEEIRNEIEGFIEDHNERETFLL